MFELNPYIFYEMYVSIELNSRGYYFISFYLIIHHLSKHILQKKIIYIVHQKNNYIFTINKKAYLF